MVYFYYRKTLSVLCLHGSSRKSMEEKMKKALSIVLCLAMLVSVCVFTASADDVAFQSSIDYIGGVLTGGGHGGTGCYVIDSGCDAHSHTDYSTVVIGQKLTFSGWLATEKGVTGYQYQLGGNSPANCTSYSIGPNPGLAAAHIPYESGHSTANFSITVDTSAWTEGTSSLTLYAVDGDGNKIAFLKYSQITVRKPDGILSLDKITAPGEYKFATDMTGNVSFGTGNYTIDLNGHKWNLEKATIKIDGATVKFIDTSTTKAGVITGEGDIINVASGKLIADGITVKAVGGGCDAFWITGGTTEIINCNAMSEQNAAVHNRNDSGNAVVTINGGSYGGKYAFKVKNNGVITVGGKCAIQGVTANVFKQACTKSFEELIKASKGYAVNFSVDPDNADYARMTVGELPATTDVNNNKSEWKNITHVSYDEIRNYDGSANVTVGGSKAKMDAISLPYGSEGIIFWGWMGTTKEIKGFSYGIGTEEPITDASFKVEADSGVVGAAKGTGATSASRFKVKVPLIGGKHLVRVYVDYTDGTREAFWVCNADVSTVDPNAKYEIKLSGAAADKVVLKIYSEAIGDFVGMTDNFAKANDRIKISLSGYDYKLLKVEYGTSYVSADENGEIEIVMAASDFVGTIVADAKTAHSVTANPAGSLFIAKKTAYADEPVSFDVIAKPGYTATVKLNGSEVFGEFEMPDSDAVLEVTYTKDEDVTVENISLDITVPEATAGEFVPLVDLDDERGGGATWYKYDGELPEINVDNIAEIMGDILSPKIDKFPSEGKLALLIMLATDGNKSIDTDNIKINGKKVKATVLSIDAGDKIIEHYILCSLEEDTTGGNTDNPVTSDALIAVVAAVAIVSLAATVVIKKKSRNA